ncbi:uncharacterized protein LOC133495944 [Syngnathoides biaculeatus]|uniref:uncharacterized protein LOC133495944 n=1 Tax=Syngnathoides biaculeatus TaxID=300417 RepID=UPI002ADDC82E|nr:uncharacterized protein LOC133495944 [Syngnathoides biaculeatus]
MDEQGDGWHNGPNSVRLPLPRGLRPPNDEPNMEFIAVLDFIVNQEIIFVNEPARWDLDENNQNNNPVRVNHVNMEENVLVGRNVDNAVVNQPHNDVVELQMEANHRTEAVDPLFEEPQEHSRNDDDEVGTSERIYSRTATVDNTSDSNTDVDEANKEPQPGPSWQWSGDEDEDRMRRDRNSPWWHGLHQRSSDSSTDFDIYEVNPLLGGSNQSLDSKDENGDMESNSSGGFSTLAKCTDDLPRSIDNSDPDEEVSDSEERLKEFIEQEPPLMPFRKSLRGKAQHQIERESSKCFQWCHGCDNDTSEKITDRGNPEENSPACGSVQSSRDCLDSVDTTLALCNDFPEMPVYDCELSTSVRTSFLSEREEVSSDEDPEPGPSGRTSKDEPGHRFETMSAERLQWSHEFCANSSDTSTDAEDTEGVAAPGTSRKRCREDDEEPESRTSKRFAEDQSCEE